MKGLLRIDVERAKNLKIFGSILIVTVMLIDSFLFPLMDGFILSCAIISMVSLIIGI